MISEVQIDSKGRIIIPLDIRKLFNLQTGEKLQLELHNDSIVLRPKLTPQEMVSLVRKFRTEVKGKTKTPFTVEKLFGE